MLIELKIVAATLVVVGIVVGFINVKFAPHTLLLESSPNRPWWLPWLALLISSLSAAFYIVLDFMASRT